MGATAAHRASRWPRKAAQLLTLTYWWPAIGLDLWSLLRWGVSEASAQRTLRALMVESILYLAVWSLVSAAASAAGATPAERPRRKPGRPGRAKAHEPLRPTRGR